MTPQEEVARKLTAMGLSLATAESLTGGLVGNLITSVPGASVFYRGGVISYATEAKEQVLGVDGVILEKYGAVSFQTALAMAESTRRLFVTDIGISTTGVAGPTEQDGQPVGTVFIGIASPRGARYVELLGKASSRNELRAWAAGEALKLVIEELAQITS